jgi:hypothetical protein
MEDTRILRSKDWCLAMIFAAEEDSLLSPETHQTNTWVSSTINWHSSSHPRQQGRIQMKGFDPGWIGPVKSSGLILFNHAPGDFHAARW